MKIIVGLSGGVDSSVATLMLLEQGYEVEALFMKNWEEDDTDGVCTAEQDLSDAQKVADKLGVKLHTINFSADYWDDVFDHFLKEHKKGRTPNPDVLCNQKIKFKVFLEHAISLGADKIATGHYARIHEDNGIYQLQTGLDNNKVQVIFYTCLTKINSQRAYFHLVKSIKMRCDELPQKMVLSPQIKKIQPVFALLGSAIFQNFYKPTYLNNKAILLIKTVNLSSIMRVWRSIRWVNVKVWRSVVALVTQANLGLLLISVLIAMN
jgi:tRNA-specific 2-thiouridylase